MAFTWFDKFTEVLESIPDDEQRDEFAAALVMYGALGKEPELAWPLNALFAAVRPDVDNSSEMRKRAARGGRPAKSQVGKVSKTQKPEVSETEKPEVSANAKPEVSESAKPAGLGNGKPNLSQAKLSQSKLNQREGACTRAFKPPTVAEVAAHCEAKGYSIDAEAFIAYYTARGWKTNRGAPIKDWRAACTTWSKNEGRFGGGRETDDGWADRYG